MENCAYLRKNPGYAPDLRPFSTRLFIILDKSGLAVDLNG